MRSVGAPLKRRRLVHAVRDHAFLPGPADIWEGGCVVIASADVEAWPKSVGVLAKWVSFLGSLHWPADGADLGVGVGCSIWSRH